MIALHVTTLGCKLNQFDSAEIAGSLRGTATRVDNPADADLVLVNTCTVTGAADADARQILRRRRRENPRALIVAAGCYAERDPETVGSLPGVDRVLRREERPRAAEIILDLLRVRFPEKLADGCADRAAVETLPEFGDRSRAFLRVQEGCDLRCSYCVIPSVRGPSRSVDPATVERRFRALLAAGYKEVVLTGVNTGDYGKDLAPHTDLPRLLERLLHVTGDFRIRLNSVEPRRVTHPLVNLMASDDRLARHLQVPLQSGSDNVLRGMRRNYRTAEYLGVMQNLRDRMPDVGLGADVIVGFPGEEDADFTATLDFIKASPLNYLHVFSYSSRPGTDAAGQGGHVDPATIKSRSRRLRALGESLARSFRRKQAGRPLRALVMKGRRNDGRRRAMTSNFIEVALESEAEENTFVDVTITAVDEKGIARGVA